MTNLSPLLRLFNQVSSITNILENLSQNKFPVSPLGVPTSVRAAILAGIKHDLDRPLFIITTHAKQARHLTRQIRLWCSQDNHVTYLPEPEASPYERTAWRRETISDRLATLTALITIENPIVVTSVKALMHKLMPLAWFKKGLHTYRINQVIILNKTLETWLNLGYQAKDVVEMPGDFSRRGGILDVFPPSQFDPIRIELFGDEIDSMRTFDPITQRSKQKINSFMMGPASEMCLDYAEQIVTTLKNMDTSQLHPMARETLQNVISDLSFGSTFSGIENYLPCISDKPASIFDYLSPNTLIFVENTLELEAAIHDITSQAATRKSDLIAQHDLSPDWVSPLFDWDKLSTCLIGDSLPKSIILGFETWSNMQPVIEAKALETIFTTPPSFAGQLKLAVQEIKKRYQNAERIVITTRQFARIKGLLNAVGVPISHVETLDYPPPPKSVTLLKASLQTGWVLRSHENLAPILTIFTDNELFGVRKFQARPQPRKHQGLTPETFFSDVKTGDYVVHIEHGIGVFQGLVRLTVSDVEGEYLEIHYQQRDKLYVPIHQSDRLSRYIGVEDKIPRLTRLGGSDWEKVKRRTKRAIVDIADELIKIYAARAIAKGRAFSPDTEWQQELEDDFPFIETEDQLHVIEEVKADMEQDKPMDRLICGDVGYGKTEIALRATFKAVMDGTQVAFLAPTTILVQQHFNSFQRRLAKFAVKVEMLSRFRTRKEMNQALAGLAKGSVDVVVGTHRLLSKDIVFKNLGLLVIDEEQRFGVSHKEHIKKMKANVDTLTLSATPIPRTMHMAMTSLRDMSVITTPPEERLPIKTIIASNDDNLIRTAITRELDRGGQIYFVHNRVIGIEQTANHIRNLVPHARVVVGHGQMSERKLEKVMLDFACGDYDILVSTTIIENGLDIRNVNTIIINRADKFGLSQLYQLRGRVGRGAEQAYSYLLIPRHRKMHDMAQKRLDAIREATELGAGFQIAMRDLEIRGAGELLGARQHGLMSDVGFDLYVRLLTQAIQALKKGQEFTTSIIDYLAPLDSDIQINLPMSAYIPEEYLPEERLRLKLYRRMANITTLDEIAMLQQEFEDRFGQLPEPVVNLLYQLKLKVLSRAVGVKSITANDEEITIRAESLRHRNHIELKRRLGVGIRLYHDQLLVPLTPAPSLWQDMLERALVTMCS